jgi:hypothetical protein
MQHNSRHAASVLHTLHVLLTKGGMVPGYVDSLTHLAAFLAAITHDYDHKVKRGTLGAVGGRGQSLLACGLLRLVDSARRVSGGHHARL